MRLPSDTWEQEMRDRLAEKNERIEQLTAALNQATISPIQSAAIRDAWEDCKRYGLNDETMHFMDNAIDAAGY